eukprot:CAMPEP_0179421784 /NCGR_PEP_ID=MMETSP0799-20121207/10012_1 /TAXON_ID=46947 /ORGANISM="Geminigera cryophila, Strain CCMP2564" /LENGTH=601 /DNA_ID=CAMNT_0021195737 /DNA_START=47 /DNA_END=1852 /DNA_ORIENTATION=-
MTICAVSLCTPNPTVRKGRSKTEVENTGNLHVYVTLSKALFIAITLAAAHPSNAAMPVKVQNVQDMPQHQVFRASSYRKGSNHMITAADVFESSLHESSKRQYGATDSEWKFVPTFIGELRADLEDELQWSTSCFKFSASMKRNTAGAVIGVVQFARLAHSHIQVCENIYLMATPYRIFMPQIELFAGTHTVVWGMVQGDEWQDLSEIGVRVFSLNQSVRATIFDMFDTFQLFRAFTSRGPAVSLGVEERNVAFLSTFAHYYMKDKPVLAHIDVDLLHSGDFIGVVRLDGLDPLIMWGTGSRVGHTAMILREDGVVYVCESQSASNYWPKDMIQKTEWSEWLVAAATADYNVVWLPLSHTARKAFNESAAWAEMRRLEGLQYGFQSLLFGWLDTPDQNLPPPLSSSFLMVGYALLEPLLKRMHATTVLSTWKQPLSKRLGLDNVENSSLTIPGIYTIAESQGLSFGQLISLPEQDSWTYPGVKDEKGHKWKYRPGPALVCSAFVCRLWKFGGLLPEDVNCGEFTPLDVYQLNIFRTTIQSNGSTLPRECVQQDNIALCQVMGRREIRLANANIVSPFIGMRQNCPSMGPDYLDRFAASLTC